MHAIRRVRFQRTRFGKEICYRIYQVRYLRFKYTTGKLALKITRVIEERMTNRQKKNRKVLRRNVFLFSSLSCFKGILKD